MRAEVADEVADLLAGLRRAREDSLRVAEYNVSLTLALNGHRREQTEKATREWRAAEEEHILHHLTERHVLESEYFRKVAFRQWSLLTRRTKALAPTVAVALAEYEHLHEYFQHRYDGLAELWRERLRKSQDTLETYVQTSEKHVADAQRRLEEVQDDNFRRCMTSTMRHIGALIVKSFFSRWADFTHKLSFGRQKRANVAKTINLIYEMGEGEWIAQCLIAWHDWTCDRMEKRGDDIHQFRAMDLSKNMRLVIFGDDHGRVLQIVVRAWCDATLDSIREQRVQQRELEARLKLDEETEMSERFPDKMYDHITKTIGLIAFDIIDVFEYFSAWKRVSYMEPAQAALIKQSQQKAQLRKNRDILYRSFVRKAGECLDDITLESYFTRWCCSWHVAQQRSREVAEQECLALAEGISAWSAQAKEVTAWLKVKKMFDVLDRGRFRELRTALQCLHHKSGTTARNAARSSVLEELAAARSQLATAVAEKKVVTDKTAEIYMATRQWQHQSRHAMIRFCVERCRECVMLMLLYWRLIVGVLRAERAESDEEARISYLENAVLARHKESDRLNKMAALRIIGRLLSNFELVYVLHGWKLGVAVSLHDAQVLDADRAWEERQMQIHHDSRLQMSERARRHSEKVTAIQASVIARVFAIRSASVQITFLSWKNILLKTHPKKVASVFLDSGSRRRDYAIFRAAFQYWRLAVNQTIHESEFQIAAEVAWLDVLAEQRRSRHLKVICDLISRNLELPLLREALALWRKLHDVCSVDKAAYDIHAQWSRWEQDAQIKLQRMAASCSALVVFTMHKVRQELFRKIAYLLLNAWRLSSESYNLHCQLDVRKKSAEDALEAQREFETLAREQWIEKCLFARSQAQNSHNVMQMWSAWQWCVANSDQKLTSRKIEQAHSVLQYSNACRQGAGAQVAFSGWHGAACRSRRRWLRRQCRRLEVALGSDGARSFRRPSGVRRLPLLPEPAPVATTLAGAALQPILVHAPGDRSVLASRASDAGLDDFATKLRTFTFGLGQKT